MNDFNALYHKDKFSFLKTDKYGGCEQTHFQIPKLHAREHYVENIKWLGAPYNYTTEISEHYHIEIAKKAYKATKCKEVVKQMLLWLQ